MFLSLSKGMLLPFNYSNFSSTCHPFGYSKELQIFSISCTVSKIAKCRRHFRLRHSLILYTQQHIGKQEIHQQRHSALHLQIVITYTAVYSIAQVELTDDAAMLCQHGMKDGRTHTNDALIINIQSRKKTFYR